MSRETASQNDGSSAVQAASVVDLRSSAAPQVAGTISNDAKRNIPLDFTKGVLVLFMVLYHWLNYFVDAGEFVYRYLRFVTPSFIFITGFLITHAYLIKFHVGEKRLPKRLFERGLKLLALFTILNLATNLVTPRNFDGVGVGFVAFFSSLYSVYITADSGGAVFQVLVPISYVLILSAVLLLLRNRFSFSIYKACAGVFLCIFALDICGLVVANLELIGIGFLGVYLGSLPITRINSLISYVPAVLLVYAGYCIALGFWGVVYPLQVAGVCLSVLLIYLAGMNCQAKGLILDRIYLLGRYSLFAYIAQIVILQLLHKVIRPMDSDEFRNAISLVAAFGLTQILVELVELGRAKSKILNEFYRMVFA